jgi:DNA adenine methylase
MVLDRCEPPSRGLVKWVGGKARLVKQRPDAFRPAGSAPVHLPFVGGGAPFFLLYAGQFAYLSDTNERLVNLYREVQRDPDALAAACDALAEAYESWREPAGLRAFFEAQRSALDHGDGITRAARLLFIVRWGYNGLYRENRRGRCNTGHGDGRQREVDRAHLRACAAALRRAEVFHADFAEACARARRGDFVYLDPPFYGGFTGYTAGGTWGRARPAQACLPGIDFRKTDRERLVEALAKLDRDGVDWTLSDARTPDTLELYRRWHVEEVQMPRTANRDPHGRGCVAELLVTNGWNR